VRFGETMARMANGQYMTKFPFWIPLDAGLTGAAGERLPVQSSSPQYDVNIVGGSTDLITSQAIFGDFTRTDFGSSGPLQMASMAPLLAMLGKRDSALPRRDWPARYPLPKNTKLRGEVLNVGGENRGHLVFAAEPLNVVEDAIPQERSNGVNMFYFSLEMNFSAIAEEDTSDESVEFDRDLLIIGAFTDTAAASIGVRITDPKGRNWCPPNDFVPVWAMAGRGAGSLPVLRWSEPVLLSKGEILRAAFKNAVAADTPESDGTITFECLELQ
jgi:hypothetical protein